MTEFVTAGGPEIYQSLKYQEYQPNKVSISGREIRRVTGDTVIYFGGTFEKPDSKSTKELKQSLADYSGNISYSLPAMSNLEDVSKFVEDIKENNIKKGQETKFIFVGYSQGSNTIIELTKKILEKDETLRIGGLILLEPVSLCNQKGLTKKFITEPFRMIESYGEYKKTGRKGGLEKLKNGGYILEEVFSIGIPKIIGIKDKDEPTLKEQIKKMSLINPNLGEINLPIVIIQGKNDRVSNSEMTDTKVFLKSDKVYQIVANNLGTHFLPVLRSEQCAKVSLNLIDRYIKYKQEKDEGNLI